MYRGPPEKEFESSDSPPHPATPAQADNLFSDEAFFGPEAETLFLTSMPGPADELGLGTVVAAAQLKLQAALPAELRDRAARIRDRFYLDAPGWYQDRDRAPPLAAVADAVWNQRQIQLRYRRWKEPTERRSLA